MTSGDPQESRQLIRHTDPLMIRIQAGSVIVSYRCDIAFCVHVDRRRRPCGRLSIRSLILSQMAQRLARQDSSSTKEEVHQDTPMVQTPPQKTTLAALLLEQSKELLMSSMDPAPLAKDRLQARPRKGRRFPGLASRAPQHEQTGVGC